MTGAPRSQIEPLELFLPRAGTQFNAKVERLKTQLDQHVALIEAVSAELIALSAETLATLLNDD